jgi:hypothetical protein
MKRDTFQASGIYLERQYDRWNGESFIAWKPNTSAGFNDRKDLLRFISWPAKTPTGDAIREWLAGFSSDPPEQEPAQKEQLTDELLAFGFGPETFQDEVDPTAATRMIT